MSVASLSSRILRVGVVVIGRNEGERLQRCLTSIDPSTMSVVYVDSGSTDDSVAFARGLGAQVLSLDTNVGFTAARARNQGWRLLLEAHPDLQFIQFVDGDCEVDANWLRCAAEYLSAHPRCAGVCGRRRERYPSASLYNALCDLEWNTPLGPTSATGGDAMFRAAALREVEGYRDDLIAGEEPEMCLRMRACGWGLTRLDLEMTRHDAAMTRFGQWWLRAVRAGHAYAEGHHLHGGSPHKHYDVEVQRILVWALFIPLVALMLTVMLRPQIGAVVMAVYPVQFLRLWMRLRRQAHMPQQPHGLAAWQALFFLLGRFAEFQGWLRFQRGRLSSRRSELIEYK